RNITQCAGLFACSFFLAMGCQTSNSTIAQKGNNAQQERVEIGYGKTGANEVTGAISTARVADTKDAPIKSAADILRGRVAGVQVSEVPGGGIRVQVRGQNTFMAGNEPLYVVDGFPLRTTNGVLFDINPHDVESITVLKDAASTAIYGSRGANGVVLITTKLGVVSG
ncbi:MAG: TonB-dependent receptor plug domain-containing protein, partial [Rhodothermales bacterium]